MKISDRRYTMGGWKLEVFKISLYMTFPVAAFWVFHQPKFYEKWMIQSHRVLYGHRNPTKVLELDNAIRQANMERQAEMDAELYQSVKQPR